MPPVWIVPDDTVPADVLSVDVIGSISVIVSTIVSVKKRVVNDSLLVVGGVAVCVVGVMLLDKTDVNEDAAAEELPNVPGDVDDAEDSSELELGVVCTKIDDPADEDPTAEEELSRLPPEDNDDAGIDGCEELTMILDAEVGEPLTAMEEDDKTPLAPDEEAVLEGCEEPPTLDEAEDPIVGTLELPIDVTGDEPTLGVGAVVYSAATQEQAEEIEAGE
jgi:hypothetical protein